VSIITYMQAYAGVLRNPHQTRARKQFEAFLETAQVLPFSPSIAKRRAQLRETLHREGKRVKARALDLMTAAIALERGLTSVTRNVEVYNDIRGLKVHKAS
jgi:predicted nucleic acid-binding protein